MDDRQAAAPDPHLRAWREGPRVGDLGEFALIDRLRKLLPGPPATTARPGLPEIRLGIGDDAAVLGPPFDGDLVWTCDIQVAGRHFLPDWMTPHEVGQRTAQINLSDIAAMGAQPLAALVSLGLPPDLPVGAVEQIYAGLQEAFGRHDAHIAGGNISRASELLIDISLLGIVPHTQALRRSDARAGDLVFTTGRPGRAAAALAARRASVAVEADLLARLREAYVAPHARIDVGRYLIENHTHAAAIDQSDGLVGDLSHICEESGVAIELTGALLPIDEDLIALGAALGAEPLGWVLGASDDYEILCTVPPPMADRVLAIPAILDVPVTLIGEVVAGAPGVSMRTPEGGRVSLAGGWDHLRS